MTIWILERWSNVTPRRLIERRLYHNERAFKSSYTTMRRNWENTYLIRDMRGRHQPSHTLKAFRLDGQLTEVFPQPKGGKGNGAS